MQLQSPRRGEILDPHLHGGLTAECMEECARGPRRVAAPVPGEPRGETTAPAVSSPGSWKGSLSRVLSLQPTLMLQGAWGRPVLYQVIAQYDYRAQRPEDLDFHQGDTVDVLCEGRRMPFPARHCWLARPGGAQAFAVSRHSNPTCLHSGRSMAGGTPRWLRWHFPQVLCGPSWCLYGNPACTGTPARRPALAINTVTRPALI